ncbi:MAG: EamA family transporter [Bacteroidota bacterium]|nr:EamA family transporter [Bacteroidota bacterium]
MSVYILLAIQVLIASGTHVVAKAVSDEIAPIPLTFLRTIISAFVLAGIFFVREKRVKLVQGEYRMLAWLSFLAVPLNQFMFMYGIRYTTAGNAALLYAITPALVLVLSHYLLKERLTRRKAAGVILAFCGVLLVIFEHGVNFSSSYTFGNIVIFMAVIAWSFYTVQSKPMIVRHGAFHMSALTLIIGAVIFSPMGAYETFADGAASQTFSISSLTFSEWGGILYLGLGTSVISYLLWFYALGKIETSKAAVFANAQPVVTSILSFLILGQTISGNFILGGVLTIAGVLLTQIG